MPTRPGPTVQRRRLGIELRRLREAAGKTIDEVAKVLECSDSKVSRIENGQVSASPRDVHDMLEFYGVEEERREELVEHTRVARRKGWWEAYSDTLAVPLVGLEVAADRILAYEAMVVHGLLQTEDYTRALIRAVRPDLSPAQIERWVTFRMTRQDLLRQPAPPTLHVVIEECALRRAVGGPGVMREQLQHLLEVGNVPNLTVQILPLSVGEHGAVTGTFHVYHFAEASSPDVVYLEHTASDLYLDNRDQVERYGATFERLTNAAMTPRKSRAFMSALTQKP